MKNRYKYFISFSWNKADGTGGMGNGEHKCSEPLDNMQALNRVAEEMKNDLNFTHVVILFYKLFEEEAPFVMPDDNENLEPVIIEAEDIE